MTCEKCQQAEATHTARFRGRTQHLCCPCYEGLVNRLLEMLEEIRKAVQ